MIENLPACMGGWCTQRDHCARFHAEDRREPAERLCQPGHDGVVVVEPTRERVPTGAEA